MRTLLIVALALIFLTSILLDKAYKSLGLKELRRRARGGKDKRITSIYKMAAFGNSLKLFLWLAGGLSAAALFLIAADFRWWLAVLLILAASSLALMDKTLGNVDGMLWRLAAIPARPVAAFLNFSQPVLGRLSRSAKSLSPRRPHTGLYEKEDLLESINQQNHQLDSRIPEADLKIAFGALTFGDKTVGTIMTPLREVKMIAAGDPIGPLLMDELHASGFSRFPVVKNNLRVAEREIVGTLYLKDLIGHTEKGHVRDVMKREVYFINETQTLRQALNAFLKTKAHLLIVVNNFEEVVGVVSIEDVIEQILGEKIVDEFDHYDDLRTVAGIEAKKDYDSRTA